MTEPLQVGQFAIVDHEPVDRGPNAGIFHGKGPVDDRAELYILAEGTTPASESFAGHVVSAAGQVWQSLDMSLTGALQRVTAQANNNLVEWNRKSIAQHRVRLGLSCFARRGSQAVIAQAGPSIVFHQSARACDIYVTEGERREPLGDSSDPRPQLTGIDFAPGDRVLLISSSALSELDDELIAGILALPADQVLANLYHRLQHLKNLTVLFVTCEGVPVEAAAETLAITEPMIGGATEALPPAESQALTIGEEPAAVPGEPFQPILFIHEEHEDVVQAARRTLEAVTIRAWANAPSLPAVISELPVPLRRAVGEPVFARMAAERHARANASGGGHGYRGARSWASHAPAVTGEVSSFEDRRRLRRRDSFTRGLVREEAPQLPPHSIGDAPLVSELVEDYRAQPVSLWPVSETIATEAASAVVAGGSLVRVRGGMSGRRRGGGGLSGGTAATTFGNLPPTWFVVLGGLAVLLLAVGLLVVPRLLGGNEGDRYTRLVDEAQQNIAAAHVLSDPAEKRAALSGAEAALLEARDLGAGPEAAQILEDVDAELAAMDAIRAPAAIETIANLQQFGDKPVAPTRLTVGGGTAYLLDGASAQVLTIQLDGSGHAAVFAEAKDTNQGRPMAIAFFAGNDLGSPSVLIVDTEKNLWAYSVGGGLRAVPLFAPSGMNITDIAVRGRELWVLDAPGGAVYRFDPVDGGFGAAVKVQAKPELNTAVRLVVDDEVLTADANGSVHRYAGQLALVLSEAGIDERLVAPEAPQPLSRNGEIAVLDASNDRIVVLRRDGTFDRQYQHKDFEAMTAFVVTEDGAAYVFSGGILRRVTF